MSILIKGMEMPQTCRGCQFCHFPGRCFDLTPVDNYFKRKDRPSWCPLIEVPIVYCCECKYNNHCLTQSFVEEGSRIPFDRNTYFCSDGVKEE